MLIHDYLVVGAGFSGAVLAERIASELNKKVLVIDKRNHIGGNCYDFFDENKICIQKYGPHIFHTKKEKVFKYLSRFTEWNDYKHKVFALHNGEYYPIPINLDTVNKFYNISLKNEAELKQFLEQIRETIDPVENSKDVVISRFGHDLYDAFVKNYTKKQWSVFPEELDKSVLSRLPIKYDDNPDYFPDDPYQGLPKDGYTKIFSKMLDHSNITVKLGADFADVKDCFNYKKIIYTGRIDQFFDYKFGKLDYRCIDFDIQTLDIESYQPNSVINHPDEDVKYSRVTEFKKLYAHDCAKTVICKETFNWDGEICYPVMTKKNAILYEKYKEEADCLQDVIFIGRLAEYKYINMDQAVSGALNVFHRLKNK